MKNKQNGSSMVEMLGVLGIVAMVSVGGIRMYSGIMDKYRISVTNTQIQSLVKKIHALYVAEHDYLGLNTAEVISNELAPSGMKISGETDFLRNKLGGKVIISTAADNESFYLFFSGLPRSACMSIGKINPDPQGKTNFVRMNVGAASDDQESFSGSPGEYTTSDFSAGTVTLNDLDSYCVSDSNNAIRWEFY